jgi:hypothetical protein
MRLKCLSVLLLSQCAEAGACQGRGQGQCGEEAAGGVTSDHIDELQRMMSKALVPWTGFWKSIVKIGTTVFFVSNYLIVYKHSL